MFKLEFETDNAAFGDDAAAEIARILRSVAEAIEHGALDGQARDINGNRVGSFHMPV